jgi:hypothetical protein
MSHNSSAPSCNLGLGPCRISPLFSYFEIQSLLAASVGRPRKQAVVGLRPLMRVGTRSSNTGIPPHIKLLVDVASIKSTQQEIVEKLTDITSAGRLTIGGLTVGGLTVEQMKEHFDSLKGELRSIAAALSPSVAKKDTTAFLLLMFAKFNNI